MVDYVGALGSRWGLSEQGCRVHTYLYLCGKPTTAPQVAAALSMSADDVAEALAFLRDYAVADEDEGGRWSTGDDPWEMLMTGLSRRRERELGPALTTLQACYDDAAVQDRALASRIGKVLTLAQDLAAIDAQASRISPRLIRSALSFSGRAARLFTRQANL